MRATAVALAAAVLSACATLAPPTPLAPGSSVATTHFDIAGRLSARRGNDGVAVHFAWVHAPQRDRVEVSSPFGQTIARLDAEGAVVRLQRPGQPDAMYSSWDAVTQATFGVAIPVEGLSAWIVGEAEAGMPFGVERDAQLRPEVLRQRGWEIAYTYAEGAPVQRPTRLVMRYPDAEPIDVRIVVDRWDAGAAAASQ